MRQACALRSCVSLQNVCVHLPPCFKGVKGLKHDNCSKIVLKIYYFCIIKSYKVIKVLLIVADLDGIVYQVHQISERHFFQKNGKTKRNSGFTEDDSLE